ncbi:MAG: phosphatase PAP2 family protein, partial [Chloroflexi bacterium]|nr:phosphatase PAP2 family protein [Chloroflexota bacterium]
MATLIQESPVKAALSTRSLLWLATIGILAALLALLTKTIMDNPTSSQDIRVMDWVAGWDLWGLTTFFDLVSFVTGPEPGIVYGLMGVTFLLLLGKTRPAIVFTAVGATIGLVAILGDFTLGEIVDRGRPLALSDNPVPAFPSGHVLGTTVFFGFMGFLAVYYKMKPKILLPMLAVFGLIIILVGPARVHVQAHFPSDVAAGYLLGAIWLLVIIPVFIYVRSTRWMSGSQNQDNPAVVACESCNVASSIASVVVLDSVEGTATKVYRPPPLVRVLYWLAFQAKFPYETNKAALQAGKYRRQIASLLTIYRFGKDLVAPVTAIDCEHGNCRFITEFIPGEVAENDAPAKKFMGEVSEIFAEAGLSVWQVNPRNPHAHTNLILSAEGDYTIIDLESAVISLLPAPGQFRSSLKSGNLPIFDDIDFPRLRDFTSANEAALTSTLGVDGVK